MSFPQCHVYARGESSGVESVKQPKVAFGIIRTDNRRQIKSKTPDHRECALAPSRRGA
ncbi:MAG: hypothetical protein KGQ46_05335 [Hyphomicrobiales bacterium]|nr:hypothetical protein [Hyphomicrobiales bacterium]MDE2113509.1 hypothetical protein [Hyphomicrobiales bacterium]